MTQASLKGRNKPTNSLHLSGETIRVRDALIDKFIDKPLSELNDFIAIALETEQDEAKRLGVLAARVYILRMRIDTIADFNKDPTMEKIPSLTTRDLSGNRVPTEMDQGDTEDADFNPDDFAKWTELRILEDGEVNGVLFPKDAVITVGPFDAYRLLKAETATYVTPPETGDKNETISSDVKNLEQLDAELSELSSDKSEEDETDETHQATDISETAEIPEMTDAPAAADDETDFDPLENR